MSKKTIINSGIALNLVDQSTSANAKTLSSIINFISRFLTVFALSAGSIFTFSSMMNVRQIDWINYLIIAVASLVFTACYKSFKKHWLVLTLGVLVSVVAGLFMLMPVISGFQVIYDSAIKSIYDAMFWTAPDPILPWNDSYITNTTYCMAMLSVTLTALVAYFAVGKIQFIGVFLVTFPFFELGAAFGCVTDKIPFALMLCGWAAMLTLHISNRQRNVILHKNADKKNNHKQFVYKNKNSRFGGSAVVMATSVFLVFVLITSVLTSTGFARGESLDNLRKDVKSTVLNIYDLITGFDHDASLKDGDLSVLGDRKVLGRHYATFQLPEVNTDVYIKGYTGAIYTGNSWEHFDSDIYKELEKSKKLLSKRELILPTLQGDLLETDLSNINLKTGKFSLSDFRRDKDYMYILNGTVSSPSMEGVEDLYPTTEIQDEYTYTAYYNPTDVVYLPYTSSYNNETVKAAWAEYTDFVYQNYTLLPVGVDEVANLGLQLQGDTIYQTVDLIREFFRENTEYSDFVQQLQQDEDFASAFLFKNGVGYSAHYATAAAVMLRGVGVPTRYVEGFYISSEQLKNTPGEGYKTVELTDGNHHAWIEIYDVNYGWIPVEVTNGYYTGSFAQMMNDRIDEADRNEQNKQPPEDNQPANPDQNEENNNNQPQEDQTKDPVVNETEDYVESNVLLIVSIIIGVIVLLILAAVLFLVIRRMSVLKKRTAIFNSTDYRLQVITAFTLLRKMLKFKKIEFEKVYDYEQFRLLLEENFENNGETKIDLDEIFDIYEKAMFSKLLITEEHAAAVLDFIDEFGYEMCRYMTFANRLKFKFIDNLS